MEKHDDKIDILINALQFIASDRFGTGVNSGLKAHEVAKQALEEMDK